MNAAVLFVGGEAGDLRRPEEEESIQHGPGAGDVGFVVMMSL